MVTPVSGGICNYKYLIILSLKAEFSYVKPMTGGIYPTYCGMYPTQSAMTVCFNCHLHFVDSANCQMETPWIWIAYDYTARVPLVTCSIAMTPFL